MHMYNIYSKQDLLYSTALDAENHLYSTVALLCYFHVSYSNNLVLLDKKKTIVLVVVHSVFKF